MDYSKRNKNLISFSIASLLMLTCGCTTSSFRILNQQNSAIEFIVTPDRVLLECERVETDDRGVVAGFMIHILDERKTSFTLVQTNTLDKESCDYRVEKIKKILKNGRQIYLLGIGGYNEPRKKGTRRYFFSGFGSIEDNGRSLQFIAIQNERNQCFGAFSAEEQPCPPEPYPIRN